MENGGIRKQIFGHIQGVPVGTVFISRNELSKAGVHRPTQAGISGSSVTGAESIVLSGGYEDDEDQGDIILYTGQGGRDETSPIQVKDQEFTHGNKALGISQQRGLPVRVIRGMGHKGPMRVEKGYRYDGLYQVTDYWHKVGKSGFKVWRYRLEKITEDLPTKEPSQINDTNAEEPSEPKFSKTLVVRRIRDSNASRYVKELYNYSCQVCGISLQTHAGSYAEGAHIRPVGQPHLGNDTPSNILSLCPNHHVLLDKGAFTISDDFHLIGISGMLNVHKKHYISLQDLEFHREHLFHPAPPVAKNG